MYKCLIVDDEPLARKILVEYFEFLSDIEIVGELGSAIEAAEFLQKEKVDILLLDINMPRLTGIQLLKNLKEPPLVIFTTAYSEYAVEAFDLEAFDYLVKPISFDRFMKSIDKAKKRLVEKNGANDNLPKQLSIKEGKRLYKINLDDIYLLQAYGDYVRIYTDEKKYTPKDRLMNIKASLPDNFVQVHRSYIINLSFLKYLEGNHVMVKEEQVPVSNSYKEDLLKYL